MAKLILWRGATALLLCLPALLFAAPRVISLSPANTELAFAAGITPIAVSAYSDYPPQAKQIEQLANWQGVNFERIVALKPDAVLAWRGGNPDRQVNQLVSLGSRSSGWILKVSLTLRLRCASSRRSVRHLKKQSRRLTRYPDSLPS
ncbi:Vitamin B12-binding protein precursor [Cedecea neteri]|uniref:Vitamin B12-binding protein n=1 Tax=Cedecea neteri TaxID=158822 RepID=A0A2X2SWG7_9ENTR|nr:Vitamin B12-binding protein precursor [Cedecea neteri]